MFLGKVKYSQSSIPDPANERESGVDLISGLHTGEKGVEHADFSAIYAMSYILVECASVLTIHIP